MSSRALFATAVLLLNVPGMSAQAATAAVPAALPLAPLPPAPPINGHAAARAQPPGPPATRQSRTIPWWSSSFTYAGTQYAYSMVGADPAGGASTTVIAAKIVPIRLVFRANGQEMYSADMVDDVLGSPAFTPVDLGLGPLQWHELIEHISLATDPNYRLILDPTVLPTQTLYVAAGEGFVLYDPDAQRPFGIVSNGWQERKAQALIDALHISPTELVIFLEYNTIESTTKATDCLTPQGCLYFDAWHFRFTAPSVGSIVPPPQINTVIWAAWRDFGAALPPGVDFGVQGLSHELAEWAMDPFVSNIVPEWSPAIPFPFCSDLLEVADPVELLQIGVPLPGGGVSVMTNAVTLSWFARQSPSLALFGLYDLTGLVTTPSSPCP